MSFKLQATAQNTRLGSHAAKSVLLLLCEHADLAGYGWPSIERIARVTELKRRTVQRVFQVFAAIGLIELRSRGPKHVPGIQVNLERLGGNLAEEYAIQARAAQSKTPGARCRKVRVMARHVTGELFPETADTPRQSVAETPGSVSETPGSVSETFSPNPYKGGTVKVREPLGEPRAPRAPEVFTSITVRPMHRDAAAELRLAHWIFEELAVPTDPAIRDLCAQAIRMQARDWGGIEPAAKRILEAAMRAQASGVTPRWRFWFTDQGYLENSTTGGNYVSRAQQRENSNFAALAESKARRDRGDAFDLGDFAASILRIRNVSTVLRDSRAISA